MAMLDIDRLSQLLKKQTPQDDGGILHSSPLSSSPDALDERKAAAAFLQASADSGRLFDTGPHRKEYEEVLDDPWRRMRDFARCIRIRLLVHVGLIAFVIVAAWTIPELAAYRTWIVVGSIVATLLFLVAMAVRGDPTEVFCPECRYGTVTFAFPYVRPCVHCGTPTCHIKSKPAFCVYCGHPMIPSKPTKEERAYSVTSRPENCVHARCTRCGKLEYVRRDVVGGCH